MEAELEGWSGSGGLSGAAFFLGDGDARCGRRIGARLCIGLSFIDFGMESAPRLDEGTSRNPNADIWSEISSSISSKSSKAAMLDSCDETRDLEAAVDPIRRTCDETVSTGFVREHPQGRHCHRRDGRRWDKMSRRNTCRQTNVLVRDVRLDVRMLSRRFERGRLVRLCFLGAVFCYGSDVALKDRLWQIASRLLLRRLGKREGGNFFKALVCRR